jgi:hypothetical protein
MLVKCSPDGLFVEETGIFGERAAGPLGCVGARCPEKKY